MPERIHARGLFPFEITKWTNADVMWHDNNYWVSVCVEGDCSREHGDQPTTIAFNTLDGFVEVNGHPMQCDDLVETQLLQNQLDEMKSEHDILYPRGEQRTDEQRKEAVDSWRVISHMSARIARKRRNALHGLTANWVDQASELTIITPRISEHTQTPHGGEKEWGAHTAIVSELNRNTLSQVPAMATAMLEYKAREAGIDCTVVVQDEPDIGGGGQLVEAGKQARRMKRQVKRLARRVPPRVTPRGQRTAPRGQRRWSMGSLGGSLSPRRLPLHVNTPRASKDRWLAAAIRLNRKYYKANKKHEEPSFQHHHFGPTNR